MSLFSWLFSKSPSKPAATAELDAKLSSAQQPASAVDPMAELKQQRHLNRESLYEVVRSVMLRSEVLSSHYKFKVLSLDTQGRHFLVMIDLLNDTALQPHRWSGVEQLMTLTALQHHDLQVKGVYWRLMMQPTTPTAVVPTKSASPATHAAPAVAAATAATSAPVAPAISGFEPIHEDEVMAFKKAIATANPADQGAPALDKTAASGTPRSVPEHGYEDTQLLESEEGSSPLSPTQLGGLD